MSKPVFSDPFGFSVRRNRKSFFLFQVTLFVVSAVLQAVVEVSDALALVAIVGLIASFVAGIATSVQRLHDLDKSGLWLLLGFVPFVNIGLLVYLYFFRGTAGANRFGQDPLATAAFFGNPHPAA